LPKLILDIENLSARHNITASAGNALAEAASVCLDRHHTPPTDVDCDWDGTAMPAMITWTVPDAKTKSTFANEEEATRDGAYAVSFATVERAENLVTISRAEKLTGADWYVAPRGVPFDDLESALRLEVSGTDTDKAAVVKQRVTQKVNQLISGKSNLPALASVVGFRLRVVAVKKVP
jgi:hypothetical protein